MSAITCHYYCLQTTRGHFSSQILNMANFIFLLFSFSLLILLQWNSSYVLTNVLANCILMWDVGLHLATSLCFVNLRFVSLHFTLFMLLVVLFLCFGTCSWQKSSDTAPTFKSVPNVIKLELESAWITFDYDDYMVFIEKNRFYRLWPLNLSLTYY